MSYKHLFKKKKVKLIWQRYTFLLFSSFPFIVDITKILIIISLWNLLNSVSLSGCTNVHCIFLDTWRCPSFSYISLSEDSWILPIVTFDRCSKDLISGCTHSTWRQFTMTSRKHSQTFLQTNQRDWHLIVSIDLIIPRHWENIHSKAAL